MLPTLNESPRYSLTVPSTGKKIRYRPYLVKEEKVLLMASETKDANQIQDAIIDTIRACTDNKLNVRELTSFDIEYLFVKLRAKSVDWSLAITRRTTCRHRSVKNISHSVSVKILPSGNAPQCGPCGGTGHYGPGADRILHPSTGMPDLGLRDVSQRGHHQQFQQSLPNT